MHFIAQNKILIAKPFLQDAFFRRAVILLAEHNQNGTIGFMVNRPVNAMLGDLLTNFKGADFPVYLGGPVSQDQLFFIHSYGSEISGSISIGDGYFWNGDYDDLSNLISKGSINKNRIKFFIGYSGWADGQLLDEMQGDSWIVSTPEYKNLLQNGKSEIWGNELKRLGSNYHHLSFFPSDPWLN
ncbi:MAG: YqgE/AlgH family protein [Bacteroidota bacterium]|jgi:putative transcriptional regulator